MNGKKRTNEHRVYWHAVWDRALKNMPHRNSQTHKIWMDQPTGTTPSGEAIRGQAHGTIQIVEGRVQKLVPVRYGQRAALARILGYYVIYKGRTQVHSQRMYHELTTCPEPREPAKRKLLLDLAGPNGTEIARKLLARMGTPMKWYTAYHTDDYKQMID